MGVSCATRREPPLTEAQKLAALVCPYSRKATPCASRPCRSPVVARRTFSGAALATHQRRSVPTEWIASMPVPKISFGAESRKGHDRLRRDAQQEEGTRAKLRCRR